MAAKNAYMLGASPSEIERLSFQAEVWRPMTEALFTRLGIGEGARCLDVGAGVGLVTLPLAQRVGPSGSVTAIEPAPLYAESLREQVARKDISNVDVFEGDMRDFRVPEARYDLIFARWVFGFQPKADVEKILKKLARGLKKGGALAIEDYHHPGCAYCPERPSFEPVVEASRAWYRKTGGNPLVAGELPRIYARLGLKDVEVVPHLRAGGPDTDIWKWGELFFLGRQPEMMRAGLVSKALAARFKKDLADIKRTPGALFIAPPVLDVVGRRR